MSKHNLVTNLALQGGGAHGAFTWGVLDRLLEEDWLEFEAISGTSAGAMNAAMLAYGYAIGGRQGAKDKLQEFWLDLVSNSSMTLVNSDHPIKLNPGHGIEYSPAYQVLMTMGWFLSPHQFNPMALNPLREIVEKAIDFSVLRSDDTIKLYIATTRARTGKIRIFENHELSVDVLLASACLPTIHHSIEIENEPYWDGAFSGNPAIYPLLNSSDSDDIIVVLLTPLARNTDPESAAEIRDRAQEMGFSSSFLREMRAIADIKERYGKGKLVVGKFERRIRDINIHIIEATDLMDTFSHSSKLNTDASFLEMLRDHGRDYADVWLSENKKSLGKKSSVDLLELFT